MTDCSTGEPLPDYWIALLWNKVMGKRVLSVFSNDGKSEGDIRTYAHCTPERANYKAGAVSFLVMNLAENEASVELASDTEKVDLSSNRTDYRFEGSSELEMKGSSVCFSTIVWRAHIPSLPQFQSEKVTPSTLLPNASGVNGTDVRLNGKVLSLQGGGLPDIQGIVVEKASSSQKTTISIAGHSINFLVFPDADVPACKGY